MSDNNPSPRITSDDLASPISDETLQQEKLSVIGHMASSVAHDLSNPLATIAASAQAILAFWPRPAEDIVTGGQPLGEQEVSPQSRLVCTSTIGTYCMYSMYLGMYLYKYCQWCRFKPVREGET